jgi:hypothetical protein
MKTTRSISATLVLACTLGISTPALCAADPGAPVEKIFDAPHGMKISVKMAAPYAQATDLQIICVFEHKASGDTYIAAMKDLDDKLGGLLSSLRNRGEFAGEMGETMTFVPPAGSMPARQFLVIGLGKESELSLQTMRLVGNIALREAVRLKAAHVSFAPVLRDQGNSQLDVGECDRSVEEGLILAYDTEKRLQVQGLTKPFDVLYWTIEAGPAFFANVAAKLPVGIETATRQISERSDKSFSTVQKPL